MATLEARDRYSRIQTLLDGVETRTDVPAERARDIADRILNHPVLGSALFAIVMALVFQAVFACRPLVDGIDYLTGTRRYRRRCSR